MLNKQEFHFCRICGKDQGEPIWGEDNKSPTFNICSCCGVEFGYEDCNLEAIHAFRKSWLTNGHLWFIPAEKPLNWSLEEQIKNIPEKYL